MSVCHARGGGGGDISIHVGFSCYREKILKSSPPEGEFVPARRGYQLEENPISAISYLLLELMIDRAGPLSRQYKKDGLEINYFHTYRP